MKTSFLATVFAPVQFLSLFVLFVLNFILFVHTGHANFGFTDVQYLQNVVFSTETGLNGPNHSSIDFPPPMKKSLTLPNFLPYPPPPLPHWDERLLSYPFNATWKTLACFTFLSRGVKVISTYFLVSV